MPVCSSVCVCVCNNMLSLSILSKPCRFNHSHLTTQRRYLATNQKQVFLIFGFYLTMGGCKPKSNIYCSVKKIGNIFVRYVFWICAILVFSEIVFCICSQKQKNWNLDRQREGDERWAGRRPLTPLTVLLRPQCHRHLVQFVLFLLFYSRF